MKKISAIILCSILPVFTPLSFAQMDVDECDSLDFESCHTKKEDSIQIFEKLSIGKKKATKVYQEQEEPAKKAIPVEIYASDEATVTSQPAATGNPKESSAKTTDKVFEIRERYSLDRSAKTPYSAFYVIEALHKQMAALCANGWTKLAEWSVPVESDFYLHYTFECR